MLCLNVCSYQPPAVDIDREDLELYELPDNCLDSPTLIKTNFLKQLKYKYVCCCGRWWNDLNF